MLLFVAMRAVVVVLLVSCNGSHMPASSAPDACLHGGGCESASGMLTLTVLDAATMAPVAIEPSFSSPDFQWGWPFACSAAGSPCPSWQLLPAQALRDGTYRIDVAAAGYATGEVTITLPGPPPGCCGIGPDVFASVALAR